MGEGEEKEEEGEEGEEGEGEETSLLDHQASLEGLDIDRWVPDHLDTSWNHEITFGSLGDHSVISDPN